MEILEILARESENTCKVYLYEEDGHWFAYEHSAYLIKQMLKSIIKIKQIVCELYDVILDRVEVDIDILIYCPITLCSDSEMILELPSRP